MESIQYVNCNMDTWTVVGSTKDPAQSGNISSSSVPRRIEILKERTCGTHNWPSTRLEDFSAFTNVVSEVFAVRNSSPNLLALCDLAQFCRYTSCLSPCSTLPTYNFAVIAPQRQKKHCGIVALPIGEFLQARKVFARNP